jgi:hypothetical protein
MEKVNSIDNDTPIATATCRLCGQPDVIFTLGGGCDNCTRNGGLELTNQGDVDKTRFPLMDGGGE